MSKGNHNICLIINACIDGSRSGQKKLYQLFFSYGMSVALRYSQNREEAEEILNEAFLKVFTKIDQYDEQYDFKKWFRRILINTSIDYFRKYKKMELHAISQETVADANENIGWENLLYEDVIQHIQKLPPSYRLAFNLFAIEGYKHHEIAAKLNISVGSSKSNYAKARRLLQSFIKKNNKINILNNGS